MKDISDVPKEKLMSLLPQCFVEEISYAVSITGIIWLVENYGGVRVFIPKTLEPAKKSFAGLSNKDIESLCAQFGGGCLDVPVATKLRRFLRNKRILQMQEDGVAKRAIARDLGMTERHVRRILNSHSKA